VSLAVHIVNTPKADTREAYERAWQRLREQRLDHPVGRESHTAWLVGDVLHVLDVWDSQEHLDGWMATLGPILQDADMQVDGHPFVGEVLQVVRPLAVH
jgi:hypothetical protein